MYIITGLGNPGSEYELTRHNVGFMAVERLLADSTGKWSKPKGGGFLKKFSKNPLYRWQELRAQGTEAILAEPLTYMNRSGIAVKELLENFGSEGFNEPLIIYDDTELPLGKVRIRPKGRSAGHNGIKSIINELGTEEFVRIKVGVGRPSGREDLADYVLSPFTSDEMDTVKEVLETVRDAVHVIMAGGDEAVTEAMNKFN